MSFGIPVRNGLAIGLLASTALSSRSGRNSVASLILNFTDGIYRALGMNYSFSSLITFTRSTTATFVGTNGLIQTAAIDAPRFDYNPSTLAAKGLLIEEQRVNSVLRSEEFNDAAWSKTASTITPNATSAPNGTTTADKLVEDTATSGHFVAPAVSPSGSLGQSYVYSVYVKAAERTFLQIILTGIGPASGNLIAGFNLANGTVGTPSATVVSTITDAGNGWFRCSAAFPISTAGSFTAQLRLALNSAASASSYTGDGVSGLFIWGAQLEAGAFVTSYIPTVASTVTRAADIAVMTGTNFSNWYNQTEGTLVAAWAGPTVATVSALGVASVTDGTINERITMRRINVNTDVGSIIIDNNVVQANLSQAGAASGENKTAVAYLINDVIVAANGTLGPSDTSVTLPTVTQLEIGFGQGITYLNGHIRTITYYPSRLTNAQLQALTV